MEDTYQRISESVSVNTGYVSRMRASLERHCTAQVSELRRLAKKQHEMVEEQGRHILDSLEAESSTIEEPHKVPNRENEKWSWILLMQ